MKYGILYINKANEITSRYIEAVNDKEAERKALSFTDVQEIISIEEI